MASDVELLKEMYGKGKEKPSEETNVINYDTDGTSIGTRSNTNIADGFTVKYDITDLIIFEEQPVLEGVKIKCRAGGTGFHSN